MLPFRQTLLCVSLSALLGVVVVFACGPFFGIEALQDRKQTLLAAPSVSFEKELASLVPSPKDKLPVAEFNDWDDKKITRESLETGELAAPALALVASMRAATDGDAAYALGDSLPPAVRQYTSGAVSFLHGNIAQAKAHFQAILDLPPADRKSRELWAHYMLGRVAAQANDASAAKTQFEATRALARNGRPDPLGLAVASFGEQARVDWERGAGASAVNLYAQQASYGSHIALDSLLTIANLILKDKDLLDKGIEDPLTRRLLFISLNKNNGETFFIGPEASDDAQTAKPGETTADILVASLQNHHITRVLGAGLLASAAYHEGRFDLAEKLSAMEDVPVNAWVKAKLALRKGDSQSALTQYEKALEGYEGAGAMDQSLRLLRAESGVLRVSRGDYTRALDLFYRASQSGWGFSDYWGDAAYVAERVLTIDELRSYINGNVPAVTIPEKKKGEEDQNAYQLPTSVHLRSLLARRLMRAGKRSEALRYFDEPNLRSAAQEYGNALDRAAAWWRWPSARAEAWFTAAKLARTQGLELLGFEKEPDFAMWEGEFSSDYIDKEPSTFQSADERKRVAASAPEKDVRFQYRLTALNQAMKSADLLPHSSQAFAAVLCEGSSWVIDRYPERAADLYHRYIHQGPHVAWAATFARTCPAPDFATASTWTVTQNLKRFERHAKAHRLLTGGIAVAIIAALFASILLLRRAAHQLRDARQAN